MRTIRFWTSHKWCDGELWRKRLCLPEEYHFVFDETDPEYLLASEHLYSDADEELRRKTGFCNFIYGHEIGKHP